ncbi:MAG: hypothetical protein ACYSUK_01325 [Planctomycetota bacterium]|jgi:hypothetical protein
MLIIDEHKRRIEGIISEMKSQKHSCVKNFECYKSKLEKLCKVEGIGPFGDIICDSEDAQCCGFSFSAMSKRYCQCPLRRYICSYFHR